jgi:hypothetical protein
MRFRLLATLGAVRFASNCGRNTLMSPQFSDILVTAMIIAGLFAAMALVLTLWKLCIGLVLVAFGRSASKSF